LQKNLLKIPRMRRAAVLLLAATLLAGCGTARNVAVTTFRVIDAPANFIRQRVDRTEERDRRDQQQEYIADVETPGRPLPPQPTPTPRTVAGTRPQATPTPRPQPPRTTPTPKTGTASTRPQPTPATTPRPAGGNEFPIAKPVPGQPGFVYSLDPQGGLVDVTGYKPGDKAKDPYTKQIFIVP
jgi:cell division protein FtsN